MNAFPTLTESSKLIYLKSSLAGRALGLVENLLTCDESYAIAMRLLNDEFLDEEFIFNKIMNELMAIKPADSLDKANEFLVNLKSQVMELQKIKYDFLQLGTSGNELLSLIVRTKLPKNIIIEISRRSSITYPKLNHIFEHFFEVRKLFHCISL